MSTTQPQLADSATARDEPLIRVDGVGRRYRVGDNVVVALADVSFEVRAEEFIVVLGPSGCGKTTLLNMIGALDSPSEGRVVVAGRDITRASRKERFEFRRHGVSFVFQTFNLFPALTALENAEFGADVAGRPDPTAAAAEMLERVGRGPPAPLPTRAVGRRAAACRNRARARVGQPDAAGRRTDRRIGLPHRDPDPRVAARAGAHRPRRRRGDP
jgi:ABC-type Fe3+/spermidine/putrescine transport system ATPase subunit